MALFDHLRDYLNNRPETAYGWLTLHVPGDTNIATFSRLAFHDDVHTIEVIEAENASRFIDVRQYTRVAIHVSEKPLAEFLETEQPLFWAQLTEQARKEMAASRRPIEMARVIRRPRLGH